MVCRNRLLSLWGVGWAVGMFLLAGPVPAQDPDSRLPVPSEEVRARARLTVKQLYAKEFSAAKTPADRVALSRKLTEEAEKAKDDPAGRYVLMESAQEQAIEAGDLELAVEAVDGLAEVYAVNALAMKEDLLRSAGRATKDPAQFAMIADRAVGLIEEAVAEDDYDRAVRFGNLAMAAAKRAKDVKLLKGIVVRLKEVRQQETFFEESQKARALLAKDANDADANLAVGRYLCFVKGDWPAGLRLLALGSDKQLQHLAAREAQKELSTDQQVALADGWWAVGEEMKGRVRDQVLLHAGSWYRRALDGLPDTLAKTRLQRRLAEIAGIKPPAPPRSSLPKLLTNSIGMKLVLIRPGEFLMGSTQAELEQYRREGKQLRLDPQDKRYDMINPWYATSVEFEFPQHPVRITKPFYLGIYEVTQAEYEAVVKKNPSYFTKTRTGQDASRHPVEKVHWQDATEYCRLLSELPAEKEVGRVYRLPTEAEWEYACRAGSKGRHSFGDDPAKLGDYAWFAENAKVQTHPVGEKLPNAWGLYDMLGNVTEWCQDAWATRFYSGSPLDDPLPNPDVSDFHMIRGGAFWLPAPMCRSASRQNFRGATYAIGLRVVCTTPETAQFRRSPAKSTSRGRQ